jgi:hypothetical protein
MRKERQSGREIDPEALMGFARTFLSRSDLYPVQQADGSYITIHKPLTLGQVEQHIRGQITLGAYATAKQQPFQTASLLISLR